MDLTQSAAPIAPADATTPVVPNGTNTTPVVPEEKKEEPVSSRFAALAKREKAIRERADAFKSEQTKFQEERAAILAERTRLEALVNEGKSNPLKVLQELGWDYQKLTEFMLNDQKPTADHEVKQLRDELGRFKKEQEEAKKKAETDAIEQQKADQERAVTQFKGEIQEHLKSNPERYEFSLLEDQKAISDLIYEVIEHHYNETGRIMKKDEAADLVELDLEEKAMGLSKLKKFQSKFQPKSEEQVVHTPTPSKTLANGLTTSSTSPRIAAKNDEERIQRALAALSKR